MFLRGDILQHVAPGVEEMSTRESFNAKNDVAVPTWLLWLEHYLRVDSFRLGIYMRIFDGGLAWKWPNKSQGINMKQIVEHTYLFEALVWVTLKGVSFCYERAKRGFRNKIHGSNLSQIFKLRLWFKMNVLWFWIFPRLVPQSKKGFTKWLLVLCLTSCWMRPFLTFLVFDGFCMHLHFTEFFDTSRRGKETCFGKFYTRGPMFQ